MKKWTYFLESLGFACLLAMAIGSYNTYFDANCFFLAYIPLQLLLTRKIRFVQTAILYFASSQVINVIANKSLLIIIALFCALVIFVYGPQLTEDISPKEYSTRKWGGRLVAIANLILSVYVWQKFTLSPMTTGYFFGEASAVLSVLLSMVWNQKQNQLA